MTINDDEKKKEKQEVLSCLGAAVDQLAAQCREILRSIPREDHHELLARWFVEAQQGDLYEQRRARFASFGLVTLGLGLLEDDGDE